MNRTIAILAALLLVGGVAQANWSDDFDSYAAGTKLHNVGGWYGWNNVAGAAGTVSADRSRSSPHSIACSTPLGEDTVHPFTGYTSGEWVFTAYQYIPSGLNGITYFILNNEYAHNAGQDWAIEMHMDPATNQVTEVIHNSGLSAPVVYDKWVEIRTEIDLDNNHVRNYYNGTKLSDGQWNIRTNGLIELQAVDLYAPHGSTVYFDDLSLVPEPTTALLVLAGLALLRRR